MNTPDQLDTTTALVGAMVDEWIRSGVRRAVLSPGSRSAPVALALAAANQEGRLALDVILDERSAAFFALGVAKASASPVVLLCSSGTAVANLHPAVIEAHYARVPLIVCTADRPPELRETGAGQAIDQLKIFGSSVRWSVEVGVPEGHPGAVAYWRSIANRSVAVADGPPAGPVQLNLAMRDPLVPSGAPVPPAEGRAEGHPWTETITSSRSAGVEMVQRLTELASGTTKGVVTCGWGAMLDLEVLERFADLLGWPVLADPISGLRQGHATVSTYDLLLRDAGFVSSHRPDFVLQIGAALTSKAASIWLDPTVPQMVVDPDETWPDPARALRWRLICDATDLLEAATGQLDRVVDRAWLESWTGAEATARRTLDALIDEWPDPFEGRIRDVFEATPEGGSFFVASSMPVRDLETFGRPRRGVRVFANRGANGIDGFVSSALGVASDSGPVVALCGDLCFLHDIGGLVTAKGRGLDVVFVVIDNDGGGIFSFLAQASLPAHFEELFGTPQGVDITAVSASLGIATETVKDAAGIALAVGEAISTGGTHIVLCRTERDDNVRRHRLVADEVARALRAETNDPRTAQ